MTDHISFPPLHDPEPSEFETRKQHLLSEIAGEADTRLALPKRTLQGPRMPVLSVRRPILLVVVVGALLGGGAAIAVATVTDDAAPAQFAPTVGSVESIPGTPSDVLTTLESRLPLVDAAKVSDVTVPPEPGSTGSSLTGLGVSYDLLVDGFGGPDITQAMWQGDLFVGAAADEFAARDLGRIVAATGTLVKPNGARQLVGGGLGNVVSGQVFDAIPSDMDATISSAAGSIRLRSVDVKTIHVLQDALVVHAVSDSPVQTVDAFRQKGGLDFLLGQSASNFEGVYLEVTDDAGNPVYIVDTAPRDGSGGFWAEPSLGLGDHFHLP